MRALALLLLWASPVLAQDGPLPMPPVINNPPLPTEDEWAERCFARTAPGWYGELFWVPRPVVVINVPGDAPRASTTVHEARPLGEGEKLGGGSSGGGDAAALLAVAVVVAAVAPIILYALDEDATPDVVGRFKCPGFELDVRGGVEGDAHPGLSTPLSVRLRATAAWFGFIAQGDVSPWSDSRRMLDTRFAGLLRATPRKHVEMGLSFGYRSLVLRGQWRPGFEVALPYEYVFERTGAGKFGLEVRPALFYWGAIDVSLELGLRIPLGPLVSLVVGGRLMSFDGMDSVGGGAQGGVAVQF